ncbi:MAG TPA: T9SS type A sorting domain-containing protein, partial [Ignavibacteriaceae bacterium]|nr:T9SS type A sorting domain-containing protein [Ignavibacteriaceae bacterium]
FRDRNGNIFRLAYSGIIKSSNKGIDWYYKNNGINTDDMGYAFACDSSGNLYYGTYMGNIYKSTNEGENWTLVRNGANPQAFLFSISVSPKNNYIYAASDREGLFKSTNEGMTWENIFPELDGNTVYVNQKGEVFAFDYNGGIFYSNDEGNNWINITNNLDHINVKDVKEDSKGNLILATWDGLYISDDPILNVDNKYNDLLYSYSLSQNFPNPFNPSTKIKYTLPKQGLVTIKIFDVLGIEIKQLINEEKPSGEYEVEFDGSSLSSGIYFYQIQTGEYFDTKKMVLMK